MFVTNSTMQLNAQVDTTLIGTWTGRVHQLGYGSYEIKMIIKSLNVDEVSGRTEYPTIHCKGINIFLSKTDSLHVFSEKIISGGCCNGRIEVYLLDSDSIQWNWYDPGTKTLRVYGKLVRNEIINRNNTPVSIKNELLKL